MEGNHSSACLMLREYEHIIDFLTKQHNVVVIQWQKFSIFLWLYFSSILSYISVFLTQPLTYQQLLFKNQILQLNLPLVTHYRISVTPPDQKLQIHQYTHLANSSYRHQNHKPLKNSTWPQKHILHTNWSKETIHGILVTWLDQVLWPILVPTPKFNTRISVSQHPSHTHICDSFFLTYIHTW
jgi:hypothetical protein